MVLMKKHANGAFSHFECRHMNHDFRWFISLINFRSFGEAFRFWTNGIVCGVFVSEWKRTEAEINGKREDVAGIFRWSHLFVYVYHRKYTFLHHFFPSLKICIHAGPNRTRRCPGISLGQFHRSSNEVFVHSLEKRLDFEEEKIIGKSSMFSYVTKSFYSIKNESWSWSLFASTWGSDVGAVYNM